MSFSIQVDPSPDDPGKGTTRMSHLTQVDPSPDDPGKGTTRVKCRRSSIFNFPTPVLSRSLEQVLPKTSAASHTKNTGSRGASSPCDALEFHRCLSNKLHKIQYDWQGATLMVGLL